MSGFQNSALNEVYRDELFQRIEDSIVKACELMVCDCIKEGCLLDNHEEKIRTYLVHNYLNNDDKKDDLGLNGIKIRFDIEILEGYDTTAINYAGRTDIRIVSDDWFKNRNAYYIVECKRLDGGNVLNTLYVKEGVQRFVGDLPKYSSFYNKNIMLGFCVKKHDIKNNVIKIENIHNHLIPESIGNIRICRDTCRCKIYESVYSKPKALKLKHLFYDFADIIVQTL